MLFRQNIDGCLESGGHGTGVLTLGKAKEYCSRNFITSRVEVSPKGGEEEHLRPFFSSWGVGGGGCSVSPLQDGSSEGLHLTGEGRREGMQSLHWCFRSHL